MKEATFTEKGALSNNTTGNYLLDYWSRCGTFISRSEAEVQKDMENIFAEDSFVAMKVIFGLRLITRKFEGIDESQTGYGRKDEFQKAMAWVLKNKPDLFYANMHLIPVFGCWKDFLNEPLINLIDKKKVYNLFTNNINNQLLLKYLPTIRSKGKVRTVRDGLRSAWAKGLCKFLNISEKQYRGLKSNGVAHTWQQQMSSKQWDEIDFNKIPGRAMSKHVSLTGKDKKTVFERHNQIERLTEWVSTQKSVKFNGYPYELLANASKGNVSLIQGMIYNKQFESLIKPFKNHSFGNVLCAVDTSGSMGGSDIGVTTPLNVCLSMGLVFSSLNVGSFKDVVCAFSSTSNLVELKGTFMEKVSQISELDAMGTTNFQSVIDCLVRQRTQKPNIPLVEYPETLIVISDMQMDCSGDKAKTNYQQAMFKLEGVGLGKMRIIWWNVSSRGTDFPATMEDKGTYLISGFDPVNLKALMGVKADEVKEVNEVVEAKKESPMDGMLNFLSQNIFNLVVSG
jgi:hypothetical protein